MLGPASLNGCTMSPVRRWKRLMSPQGVFHVAEVGGELVGRRRERLEPLLRRGSAFACNRRATTSCLARLRRQRAATSPRPRTTASDVGTESRRPAIDPTSAASSICSGELRLQRVARRHLVVRFDQRRDQHARTPAGSCRTRRRSASLSVKSFLSSSTRMAWMPRGFSPLRSTYAG